MDNSEVSWLAWHWLVGICLTVMCLISVGIVFASLRPIDYELMQDLVQDRRYWEMVLFAAIVFGTTMAVALLLNF
jgi:hypothetical protein